MQLRRARKTLAKTREAQSKKDRSIAELVEERNHLRMVDSSVHLTESRSMHDRQHSTHDGPTRMIMPNLSRSRDVQRERNRTAKISELEKENHAQVKAVEEMAARLQAADETACLLV